MNTNIPSDWRLKFQLRASNNVANSSTKVAQSSEVIASQASTKVAQSSEVIASQASANDAQSSEVIASQASANDAKPTEVPADKPIDEVDQSSEVPAAQAKADVFEERSVPTHGWIIPMVDTTESSYQTMSNDKLIEIIKGQKLLINQLNARLASWDEEAKKRHSSDMVISIGFSLHDKLTAFFNDWTAQFSKIREEALSKEIQSILNEKIDVRIPTGLIKNESWLKETKAACEQDLRVLSEKFGRIFQVSQPMAALGQDITEELGSQYLEDLTRLHTKAHDLFHDILSMYRPLNDFMLKLGRQMDVLDEWIKKASAALVILTSKERTAALEFRTDFLEFLDSQQDAMTGIAKFSPTLATVAGYTEEQQKMFYQHLDVQSMTDKWEKSGKSTSKSLGGMLEDMAKIKEKFGVFTQAETSTERALPTVTVSSRDPVGDADTRTLPMKRDAENELPLAEDATQHRTDGRDRRLRTAVSKTKAGRRS